MKKMNEELYDIALKLKTNNQRAVFCFIYENPDCCLGEIRQGTGIDKHGGLSVIRQLRDKGLIFFREDVVKHVRHYTVEYDKVDALVDSFMEQVELLLGD